MASRDYGDRHADSRRQPYDRDGGMYDDEHYDRQAERATTWPRPSPSHGRSRTPPHHDLRWDPKSRDFEPGREPSRDGRSMQIRGRATDLGQYDYRDRDREGYKSPRRFDRSPGSRHRSRSRSYSPNRRPRSPRNAGQPSREVMLDGLSLDISEEDLRLVWTRAKISCGRLRSLLAQQIAHALKTRYRVEKTEDIRVIRDRRTGESRGFGFVRFSSLPEARSFLDANFPIVQVVSSNAAQTNDQGTQVRIAYSREREERPRPGEGEGDWTCNLCSTLNFSGRTVCFKCNSPPVDMAAYQMQAQQQEYLNSGDSDAAVQGPASQYLLVRGLEPNVTEELLAKGVSKLLKPTLDQAQPTKKTKISSTTDNANLGARDGSIRRVFLVRDRHTDETWRYGFAEFATVDDAAAAMVRFNSYDRFTISSKPVSVTYIHTGVFVPVLEATEERFAFTPLGNPAARLRYWNEYAFASEHTVTGPEDDDAATEADKARQAANLAAAAAHKEGLIPIGEEQDAKAKKRKAESKEKEAGKNKKTTPVHLQFWSNRHAELHGIKSKDNANTSTKEDAQSSPKDAARVDAPPQQSYADLKKICCYLCSRQFKSIPEVNKHERLSQLHRDNIQNGELRQKAIAKLKKAGLPILPVQGGDEDGTEYRDRARERRQAFGPSKKISLPMKKQPSEEAQAKPAASSSPPAPSKGAALLGKMGWSAGEGLGARGEGQTEAIATNLYAAGVGLGAEGGKIGDAVEEAARSSRGDYKEFLQKTKDKAKARYESMS